MTSSDISVVHSAIRWHAQGLRLWLCTVLHTWGSAPRSPGALLAVSEQGNVCGSLSGGCIEEDFLRRLAAGEFRQPSQTARYGADGIAPDIALPCGGSLEILIEYLDPTTETQRYLQQMQQALGGKLSLIKRVIPGQSAQLTSTHSAMLRPAVAREGQTIVLQPAAAPGIVIAGLSPVAEYCISLAKMLGFHLTLCEHRAEKLAEFSANHPLSDDIEIVRQFPARYLEQFGCTPSTAVLSLTHDARIDDLSVMEACLTPAFYIGVLGSQRTSDRRRVRLAEMGDLDAQQLARISAPVGLNIGSKTPPEIALAIMADIVRVKNGIHRQPDAALSQIRQ